jgi:hypothetical protein
MKGDTTTFDEYRTGYIAEKHNVSDNCARALQLFEIGFTVSGAAKRLPVTESTVAGYKSQLMNTIHENVVFTLTSRGPNHQFDVWGNRDVSNYGEYGYDDGVRHARESECQATDRANQIDPDLRDRERSINRGRSIEEIPDELITVTGGDN